MRGSCSRKRIILAYVTSGTLLTSVFSLVQVDHFIPPIENVRNCAFAVSRDKFSANSVCRELCEAGVVDLFEHSCFFEPYTIERAENDSANQVILKGNSACFHQWTYGYGDLAYGVGSVAQVGEVILDVVSAAACQERCQISPNCAAFTWNAVNGLCLLKTQRAVNEAITIDLSSILHSWDTIPLSDHRWQWCNLGTAWQCDGGGAKCLSCGAVEAVCAVRSRLHVSGPKYCASVPTDPCNFDMGHPQAKHHLTGETLNRKDRALSIPDLVNDVVLQHLQHQSTFLGSRGVGTRDGVSPNSFNLESLVDLAENYRRDGTMDFVTALVETLTGLGSPHISEHAVNAVLGMAVQKMHERGEMEPQSSSAGTTRKTPSPSNSARNKPSRRRSKPQESGEGPNSPQAATPIPHEGSRNVNKPTSTPTPKGGLPRTNDNHQQPQVPETHEVGKPHPGTSEPVSERSEGVPTQKSSSNDGAVREDVPPISNHPQDKFQVHDPSTESTTPEPVQFLDEPELDGEQKQMTRKRLCRKRRAAKGTSLDKTSRCMLPPDHSPRESNDSELIGDLQATVVDEELAGALPPLNAVDRDQPLVDDDLIQELRLSELSGDVIAERSSVADAIVSALQERARRELLRPDE